VRIHMGLSKPPSAIAPTARRDAKRIQTRPDRSKRPRMRRLASQAHANPLSQCQCFRLALALAGEGRRQK
jgi:hypothetical protein